MKAYHERGGLWVTDLTPDEPARFSPPALGAGPFVIGETGAETATELAAAMGGWDPAERSRVLDLLGFDGQLVFGTFATLMYKLNSDLDLNRLAALMS